jgi:hypothetical protein
VWGERAGCFHPRSGVKRRCGRCRKSQSLSRRLKRTLVSGAARIPACTNCCGSGVVHFRKESSSACTARGFAAKGRAKDCTAPRLTTARRAIFSPSLRSVAICGRAVCLQSGGPAGRFEGPGESKKIFRPADLD